MKIVVNPLADVYDTIVVHVTELEAFDQCPKKFNQVPRYQNKAMSFGTKLHEMLQYFLYNKEKNYNIVTELYIETEEDPIHRRWLSQMLDLAYWEVPETFMADRSLSIEVECGIYLLIIKGTLDNLHSETWELSDAYLSDHKTAASFWKEDSRLFKLQPFAYTWARRASLWVFEWKKRFDYHIYKKLKKQCQYQHIQCEIDLKDAELRIMNISKRYLAAHHAKIWKARKNIFCNWCPLKKQDKCEIFNPILSRTSNLNEGTTRM